MTMRTSDLQRRTIDSNYFTVDFASTTPESPLMVGEKLTIKLIERMDRIGLLESKRVDYSFYEAWRSISKNKYPGFVILADNPNDKFHPEDMRPILKVEWDVPGRTLISEEDLKNTIEMYDYTRKPSKLRNRIGFCVGANYSSPLVCKDGAGLGELLRDVQKNINPSEVRLGYDFYKRFEGSFSFPSKLPVELIKKLEQNGELLDGNLGRYVIMISNRGEHLVIDHGHIRRADTSMIGMTDWDYVSDKNTITHYSADSIIGVFGKGIEQLYVVERSS